MIHVLSDDQTSSPSEEANLNASNLLRNREEPYYSPGARMQPGEFAGGARRMGWSLQGGEGVAGAAVSRSCPHRQQEPGGGTPTRSSKDAPVVPGGASCSGPSCTECLGPTLSSVPCHLEMCLSLCQSPGHSICLGKQVSS